MKGRKKRETGGVNAAAEDLRTETPSYTADSNVVPEAREKKKGGRAKRRDGGMVHREQLENLKHAKHVGRVQGGMAAARADRAPRKSGGRAGSDSNPFSSARRGERAPGRTVQTEYD